MSTFGMSPWGTQANFASGGSSVNVQSGNNGATSVNVDSGDNSVAVQTGNNATNVNVTSPRNIGGFAGQNMNQAAVMNRSMNSAMSLRSAAHFGGQNVDVQTGANGATAVNVENGHPTLCVNKATSVEIANDNSIISVNNGFVSANPNACSPRNTAGFVDHSMNHRSMMNRIINAAMSPRNAAGYAGQNVTVRTGANGTTAVNVESDKQAVAVNSDINGTAVNVAAGNAEFGGSNINVQRGNKGAISVNVDSGDNSAAVQSGINATNVNVSSPRYMGGFVNPSMNQASSMNRSMNSAMSPRTPARFAGQNVNVQTGANGTTAVNVESDKQAVAVNSDINGTAVNVAAGNAEFGGSNVNVQSGNNSATSVNVDSGDNSVAVQSGNNATNVSVSLPRNMGGFVNQSMNQASPMNRSMNSAMSRSGAPLGGQHFNVQTCTNSAAAVNVENGNQMAAVDGDYSTSPFPWPINGNFVN